MGDLLEKATSCDSMILCQCSLKCQGAKEASIISRNLIYFVINASKFGHEKGSQIRGGLFKRTPYYFNTTQIGQNKGRKRGNSHKGTKM